MENASQVWQAIRFRDKETIGEFLEQFQHFDSRGIIEWSALGGVFTLGNEIRLPVRREN